MPLHQAAVTPALFRPLRRPLRRPLLAARNAVSAVAALALLALGHASPVLAQDWPQSGKTLRILSPFPPGGTADQLARLIGARLSQQTGVVAVVDNRPGGSTLIAVNELKRAAPDGYTVLYTVTGTTSQLPHLYAKSPVDPFNDFTPLGLFAYNQLVLTIPPSLPAKTVKELVEYARANPGKMNYASFGNGSFPHIVSELLKANTGIEMTHVPFKGGADAGRAVMSGEVQLLFDAPVTGINNARGGKLRALASTGPNKVSVPGMNLSLPTMAEAGFPGFDVPGLEQLLGPPGMPRALADRVNAEIMKIAQLPEIRDIYVRNGFEFVASNTTEHARVSRDNHERWGAIIRKTGIKLD